MMDRGNKMKKLTVRGISTHEESKGEWEYGYLQGNQDTLITLRVFFLPKNTKR